MHIRLTYDLVIDFHFLFTGRYPPALKDEITKSKEEIYAKLSQDLVRPYLLTGIRQFQMGNKSFNVYFASDTRENDDANDIRPLRVIYIEEEK